VSDLEGDVRAALDEQASSAPPPHEGGRAVARTRRRQGVTIASGVFGVAAVLALSLVAARAIRTPDGGTPATPSLETTTMNGIEITHPEVWQVLDPDAAGLNGPEPTSDLPRLVLALTPIDTGELLACPEMVEGEKPTFLLTIQEEPLALDGDPAAVPWPVDLQPLSAESAQFGSVGSIESGCYSGWGFLRAGWTEAGRTFEARVGIAPEITDQDREAVVEAFSSMAIEAGDPVQTPLPEVPEPAQLEHGGVVWGVYLAVGESSEDPVLAVATARAETLGYPAGVGDIACDQPAAEKLGVPPDSSAVAIYFNTREDAESAAALFDPPPVGIAKVTTYCLD
jgi:hypothetical protein